MTLDCSVEAQALYSVLDPLLTRNWASVRSYDGVLRSISHQLPPHPWRTELQELSSHSIIAYAVIGGVDHVSHWCDRFPKDFSYRLLCGKFHEYLYEPTLFSWDMWSDLMRSVHIETESLYQLNKTYLSASRLGLIKSERNGTVLTFQHLPKSGEAP